MEAMKQEDETSSSTFIMIAGVVIVLVFIALFISKQLLQKQVVVAHLKNSELSKQQLAKTKGGEFKKIDIQDGPSMEA